MLTKSWIHGLTLKVLTSPFTKRGVNWVKLYWHVLQKCHVRPGATRKEVNFGWHLIHHTTHLWCIQYYVKVDQTNSARELLQLSWKHDQKIVVDEFCELQNEVQPPPGCQFNIALDSPACPSCVCVCVYNLMSIISWFIARNINKSKSSIIY